MQPRTYSSIVELGYDSVAPVLGAMSNLWRQSFSSSAKQNWSFNVIVGGGLFNVPAAVDAHQKWQE